MSNLTKAEVVHLANLARLALSDEETERYTEQLAKVVSYVDQLTGVATKEVGSFGVSGLVNVMGADEERVQASLANLDPREALSSAPLFEGDNLVVRAVMGATEGGEA